VADAERVADHEGGDLGAEFFFGVPDAAEAMDQVPVQSGGVTTPPYASDRQQLARVVGRCRGSVCFLPRGPAYGHALGCLQTALTCRWSGSPEGPVLAGTCRERSAGGGVRKFYSRSAGTAVTTSGFWPSAAVTKT